MKAEQLARRDGWQCWLCGGEVDPDAPPSSPAAPTVDHVVPRSRGGRTEPSNLRLAHRRCNGRRGNRLPELDWPAELALMDAPSLWQSLRRIVTRAQRSPDGHSLGRRRHSPDAKADVVALAPTAEAAALACSWVEATAERFLGGTWTATADAVGVGDARVIRLSVQGPVADPGRPLSPGGDR